MGRHGQRRRRSGGRGEEVGIDDGAGVALNPGNQTGASRIERHKHHGATDGADGGDAGGAILVAAARQLHGIHPPLQCAEIAAESLEDLAASRRETEEAHGNTQRPKHHQSALV